MNFLRLEEKGYLNYFVKIINNQKLHFGEWSGNGVTGEGSSLLKIEIKKCVCVRGLFY